VPPSAASFIKTWSFYVTGTTITGRVHWWSDEKKFGFIRRSDYRPGDKDDFVHISAVEAAGIRSLEQGDEVTYELAPDKRHPERLIVANLKVVQ
jgi:CspA family cold shock protein